jgi:hypothetical protein
MRTRIANDTGGFSLRRFNVFVLGVVLGAALFWGSAYAGFVGFTSVEGAAFSALLLLALVIADLALGGFLARTRLRGGGSSRASRRREKGVGLFVGGSIFLGALVSGLFLGAMILLNTPPLHRSFFAFAAGPGLGLVYGMVFGMPALVGSTLVELKLRARRGDS